VVLLRSEIMKCMALHIVYLKRGTSKVGGLSRNRYNTTLQLVCLFVCLFACLMINRTSELVRLLEPRTIEVNEITYNILNYLNQTNYIYI